MTHAETLMNAPDIFTLCEALNALTREEWDALGNVVTNLPTFGGDEPTDTRGVFSWDPTFLLVRAETNFALNPRAR